MFYVHVKPPPGHRRCAPMFKIAPGDFVCKGGVLILYPKKCTFGHAEIAEGSELWNAEAH